jgi:hypothetical protein
MDHFRIVELAIAHQLREPNKAWSAGLWPCQRPPRNLSPTRQLRFPILSAPLTAADGLRFGNPPACQPLCALLQRPFDQVEIILQLLGYAFGFPFFRVEDEVTGIDRRLVVDELVVVQDDMAPERRLRTHRYRLNSVSITVVTPAFRTLS